MPHCFATEQFDYNGEIRPLEKDDIVLMYTTWDAGEWHEVQPESFERHADGELGGEGWPVPGKALLFHGPKQSRYQQSKLANFVYAYALRDRCASAGSKVKALVAHPGICQTQLFANGPKKHGYSGIRVGELFFPIFMMSLDDGAQAIFSHDVDGRLVVRHLQEVEHDLVHEI